MSNDIFVWVEHFKGQPAGASGMTLTGIRRRLEELGVRPSRRSQVGLDDA